MYKIDWEIDIGDAVICDICNEDYTNSEEIGGIVFADRAICPKCEARWRQIIRDQGEEIDAECQVGMSFKEFILSIRPHNKIFMTDWPEEGV